MSLDHPAVQSGLLPLLIGLGAAGLLHLLGGRDGRGAAIASAAVPLALLVSAAAVLGLPPIPPHTALQKTLLLAAAGLALGLCADGLGTGRRTALGLALAALAMGSAWLAWPLLEQPSAYAKLGGVGAAGALVLGRLSAIGPRGRGAPALLLMACVGLAAVAGLSGSLVIAQLAAALGAGVAGFAMWGRRVRFGAGGLIGGGVSWLLLALLALLLTDAAPVAIALLALVFLADRVSERLPGGSLARATPDGGDPVSDHWPGLAYLFAIAALPIAAAVVLALGSAADSPYYR